MWTGRIVKSHAHKSPRLSILLQELSHCIVAKTFTVRQKVQLSASRPHLAKLLLYSLPDAKLEPGSRIASVYGANQRGTYLVALM